MTTIADNFQAVRFEVTDPATGAIKITPHPLDELLTKEHLYAVCAEATKWVLKHYRVKSAHFVLLIGPFYYDLEKTYDSKDDRFGKFKNLPSYERYLAFIAAFNEAVEEGEMERRVDPSAPAPAVPSFQNLATIDDVKLVLEAFGLQIQEIRNELSKPGVAKRFAGWLTKKPSRSSNR